MHESIGFLLKRNYYETDFLYGRVARNKVTFFFIPIYGLPQTLGFILSMILQERYDYKIEAQSFVQVSIMFLL